MARCLIVGCGCCGAVLAGELVARGHAVRGTTRSVERAAVIEQAGAEAFVGDPDRVATIAPALERVSVICILLGSARGSRDALAALHGTRLEMLLARVLDSPARGIVYEARGSVPAEILAGGAGIVRAFCEGSRIPYAVLEAERDAVGAWSSLTAEAVERVLGGG